MEKYLEELLTQQLNTVLSDLELDDYKLFISSEQQFHDTYIAPKDLYIIYKEGGVQPLFGNKVLPITFYCLSEQGSLEVARALLNTFVSSYNQVYMDFTENGVNIKVYPVYSTPIVNSNFIQAGVGVRSQLSISGQFVIMRNMNDINSISYIGTKEEEINCLNINFAYNSVPDTQPNFYNDTNTSSIVKYSSFTLSFGVQFTNSEFLNKVNEVIFRKYAKNNKTVNETFTFKIKFNNGKEYTLPLKLYNCTMQKNIGALTSLNLSFLA